jgi:hypothetical protein
MNINCVLTLALLLGTSVLVGCGGSHIPPDITPNLIAAQEIRSKLSVVGDGAKEEEVQIEFGNQFATLTGTITLDGPAPTNPPLNVNKDLGVCKPGGSAVINEIVVVGSNNGLANVLVYADVPAEWCHETMIGNTDTVDFDQKNCLFLNRIFPMQTTQNLRILNSDTVGHNASLKPSSRNPEYNPQIAGGGEVMYPPGGLTLKQEKSPFPVNCAAHPWMQSYMIFRNNGYFAVTGDDGSFEIPNLPANVPVKVSVWHEASRSVPGSAVSVEPSGIAEGWNKRGAFTVNLEPDSVADLKIAINSAALSK